MIRIDVDTLNHGVAACLRSYGMQRREQLDRGSRLEDLGDALMTVGWIAIVAVPAFWYLGAALSIGGALATVIGLRSPVEFAHGEDTVFRPLPRYALPLLALCLCLHPLHGIVMLSIVAVLIGLGGYHLAAAAIAVYLLLIGVLFTRLLFVLGRVRRTHLHGR